MPTNGGDQNVPIEHGKLIDSVGLLRGFRLYRPIKTFCGICDAPFTLSPAVQKYILEVNRVPVKMLQRGAIYCVACRRRRSRIKWRKRGDRWRTEPKRKEELDRLVAEEEELKRNSKCRYETAKWRFGLLSR